MDSIYDVNPKENKRRKLMMKKAQGGHAESLQIKGFAVCGLSYSCLFLGGIKCGIRKEIKQGIIEYDGDDKG